jgi:hypothetical protein
MGLADQWRSIRASLPDDWGEATLNVSVARPDRRPRAAALLGPASPGRLGDDLRLAVYRAGGGVGPDQAAKLFGKLDEEKIGGTLSLVETGRRVERPQVPRAPAAVLWTAAVATLPDDWSDLLCEVELASSDHLARGALLLAPLNPTRMAGQSALRFRVARRSGYGASPEMTHRCLERLDSEDIAATLKVVHALSDTDNVGTQGPVWRVGGKAV